MYTKFTTLVIKLHLQNWASNSEGNMQVKYEDSAPRHSRVITCKQILLKPLPPHCCGQQKPNCDKTKQTEAWQTKFIMKKRELLSFKSLMHTSVVQIHMCLKFEICTKKYYRSYWHKCTKNENKYCCHMKYA